ncbi:MAG: response regulator [Deltaproteobacteria bacterium]|nr:response regulator [Deltaproteobacteria bacterium]
MADDFEGTVLIAEDDEAIRDGLSMSLEIEGYRVLIAADGREALELLPTIEAPCLLLLDLLMPVMNGWELLEAKNADPALAPIPVVVLSSADEKQRLPGVAAFVPKPYELDKVINAIRQFCGRSAPRGRAAGRMLN